MLLTPEAAGFRIRATLAAVATEVAGVDQSDRRRARIAELLQIAQRDAADLIGASQPGFAPRPRTSASTGAKVIPFPGRFRQRA